MKTIEYNRDQLIELKPNFLRWLDESWCDCKSMFAKDPEYAADCDNECQCYGRDEYDEVWKFVMDDDSARIYYAHEADPTADHQRQLIMPWEDADHPPHECNDGLPLFNRRLDGEPYIKSGDLEWVGDDCDYMGPILDWLIEFTKEAAK